MVGRFVAGIGFDYALMIAPVYTAEISPAYTRGFLTSFPEVFINAGVLLGYVSNYAFSKLSTHLGWRMMLGVSAILSVALAIGGPCHAGVATVAGHARPLVEAKRVLNKTTDSKEEAQIRLSDIKEAAGIPLDYDDIVQVTKRSHGEGVWKELFI
ncbi:hypothetical protein SLE2022_258730 [Rubroshorea leprosula]